jgi:hypothetical protein
MAEFHRFVRLQLWRLSAVVGALFVLASILGAHTVLRLLEWTPMAICVLILAAEVRKAIAPAQRRRR